MNLLTKIENRFFLIPAVLLLSFAFGWGENAAAQNSAAARATKNQTATAAAAAAGSVTREIWLGIGGTSIAGIPLLSAPTLTDSLTSLEAPTNWADDYGTRIRGYITAPQTGSYTFWIAGDDDCEFWLSTTDQPTNKTRIAYLYGWTSPREWLKYATQKSVAVHLTAGQRYYFEALHKDGVGGDNLAVGWSQPGQNSTQPQEVVPGGVLSPVQNLTSQQARSADAFVDSIGVNIHLGYTGGVYDNYYGTVKPRLQELGVRHVRDGLEPRRLDTDAKLKDLYNTLGIKSLLIMNPSRHTVSEGHNYVKNTLGAEKISAIEGINEPNNFIGGCCWIETTRNFQREMFQIFRNDPATAGLPFLAPSLVVLDPDATAAHALGDLSAYVDFGNIHNYYGGRNPETNGWGGNGYGGLTFNLTRVAPPVSGAKPVWSTETGYHNAWTTTSGHKYTPERVVARYMPRLFLHQFNRGVVRSYPYEFIDQGTDSSDEEQNFGLLRYNNTPKPAFTALKNLIALLNDPGANFAPGALDYTLSGEMQNVQQTLLQKRDGTFYLVLWNGSQRWHPDAQVESEIPNQTVTVTLNKQFAVANTYLPLNGANVVNSFSSPTQITVSVPDHPLVIELKSSGGTTTPPSVSVANGVYRIVSEGSGKALDVEAASYWNGANVLQWTAHGGANQDWLVERLSGGDYRLSAVHSGKSLDVEGFGTHDGANVHQWDQHGGANQRWQIVSVGGDSFKILSQNAPDKALEVAGASTADGANVQIWTFNNTANQRWRLEFVRPLSPRVVIDTF